MNKIDNFNGKYKFLSNFFNVPVTYDGLTFQNNEAAFQSAKSLDPSVRNLFVYLDASQAKRLGRKIELRSDWEHVKYDIMYDVCKAKFDQNPKLKRQLLATEDAYLEEGNTWNDRCWGTCNGIGDNNLGKILMRIRDEYNEQE